MTDFLASVTSIDEARIALECGADIIDLKNPLQGALGALPIEEVEEIVRFVDGKRPVSATIGDLPMQPDILRPAVARMAETGVDIVKVGFFGDVAHDDCVRELMPIASCVKLVAVLFADQKIDFSLLRQLAECGFYGAMLDTATKNGAALSEWMSFTELQAFLGASREDGLVTGLAGSLRVRNVSELLGLNPDYLGFRGALCLQNLRESRLDSENVKVIANMLREYNNHASGAEVQLQS